MQNEDGISFHLTWWRAVRDGSRVVALAVPLVVALGGCATTKEAKMPDHFDGNRFHNPGRVGEKGFGDIWKWFWTRQKSEWPRSVVNQTYPSPPASVEGPDEAVLTFVNHASFLIQVQGWNILTDPQFSMRASPISWAGPRRVREPGVHITDLPRIDLVLVSHNHYDHLDLASLRRLQEAYRPIFLAGLGNKAFLESQGLERVEEMDWWEERVLDNGQACLLVMFTPAQHFSARGFFDRNKTLWGGFMINAEAGRIFFAGDTGYSPHFTAIREKLGAPDVSLLPIGAYEPRWFMKDVHMNPEEAVQAHLDLQSRQSLGMHFGTFQLTDEPIDEPVTRVKAGLQARGLAHEVFRTLDFGEAMLFKVPAQK